MFAVALSFFFSKRTPSNQNFHCCCSTGQFWFCFSLCGCGRPWFHYTGELGLGLFFVLGVNSVADCVGERVCATLLCWILRIGVGVWVWEHVDKPYFHTW